MTGLQNHRAAHFRADERSPFERHVPEVVIAVVMCIHHVCDGLLRDLSDRRRNASSYHVRATRVDKDYSLIAHDDSRVDHVPLVEFVRVLNSTEKNVDPIIELSYSRFGQRLTIRREG